MNAIRKYEKKCPLENNLLNGIEHVISVWSPEKRPEIS